jgi:hypothetical protein
VRKARFTIEQPPIQAPWYDYKYIHRGGGTIDGRKDAERIKRLYESPKVDDVPRSITSDVETGVEMMMYAAGVTPSREVPWYVNYLLAHQYVQDYHAGLKLTTYDAVARCACIVRAAMIVGDALDAFERGREERKVAA